MFRTVYPVYDNGLVTINCLILLFSKNDGVSIIATIPSTRSAWLLTISSIIGIGDFTHVAVVTPDCVLLIVKRPIAVLASAEYIPLFKVPPVAWNVVGSNVEYMITVQSVASSSGREVVSISYPPISIFSETRLSPILSVGV